MAVSTIGFENLNYIRSSSGSPDMKNGSKSSRCSWTVMPATGCSDFLLLFFVFHPTPCMLQSRHSLRETWNTFEAQSVKTSTLILYVKMPLVYGKNAAVCRAEGIISG